MWCECEDPDFNYDDRCLNCGLTCDYPDYEPELSNEEPTQPLPPHHFQELELLGPTFTDDLVRYINTPFYEPKIIRFKKPINDNIDEM